jgi:hypothetical protein
MAGQLAGQRPGRLANGITSNDASNVLPPRYWT